MPLLPAFSEMFHIPSTISACNDAETVSFDNMQLSAMGAERQKKDVTCQNLVIIYRYCL